MAYVIKRKDRYTAYYKAEGKTKSAGTYPSRAKALQAGILAEQGVLNLLPNNQPTFDNYVEKLVVRTDVRVITRKTYLTLIKKYAQPSFANKPIASITKRDIRKLFDQLMLENNISKSTLSHLKTSLGYLFRLAVEDEAIATNPTHRIRIPLAKPDPTYTLEPKDFQRIQKNLPTEGARLFARFLVGSGCRYGEATELRVKDFNFQSKEVYIRRTVSDVGKDYNNGDRFLIVSATKNNNKRTVVLSAAVIAEIQAFVTAKALAKEDLVFSKHLVEMPSKIASPSKSIGESYTVGSRVFQHSTAYSYNVGGCRCEACKQAVREYRNHWRKDRKKGKGKSLSKSQSRSRSNSKSESLSKSESHLPRDRWRTIWNEAIKKSGIGWYPTTHDLRHANATQLLKNGVDVHEVKERLGHQSIVTTERYLHRIRHQQSKASELVNDYLE